MADTKVTTTAEPKKSGSGKKILIVLLLLLACCGVCALLFVAASVLGYRDAKDQLEEEVDNIVEEDLSQPEDEDDVPSLLTVADLSKCDGNYEGERVTVSGYFQTPLSVYCFGTCSLDFAGKFDAPSSSPKITTTVDFTKTDGANTVTFPASYKDITDFTFLDDAGNKLNASKSIKLTGTWQVTDNSDTGAANTCKLSVDEMVQAE